MIKFCLFWIFIIQPITQLTRNDLKERHEDCKNYAQKTLREVTEELSTRWENRVNRYFNEYSKTSLFISNGKNVNLIKASKGGTAIIIVVILLATILMVVIILAILNKLRPHRNKIFLFVGIGLGVFYTAFFWASFGTEIQQFRLTKSFYCDYNQLLHELVYGNDGG